MTTTAYDTFFIASDIAFTDTVNDVVHLDIPFRKVKRIDDVVLGMAGCLDCMVDFANMVLNYATNATSDLVIPKDIESRVDRDFLAMVNTAGVCLKFIKLQGSNKVDIENITQIPTVIGSGSFYVTDGFNQHKNAVVAVMEAIKHDKYTDGEVKYCSVHLEDVHNLELNAMSQKYNFQIAGMQNEIQAANEFLNKPENAGKVFHASTRVHHVGTPDPMPVEAGLAILKQGLQRVRSHSGTKTD